MKINDAVEVEVVYSGNASKSLQELIVEMLEAAAQTGDEMG